MREDTDRNDDRRVRGKDECADGAHDPAGAREHYRLPRGAAVDVAECERRYAV
jgi:hypothetical protein